MVAGGAAPARWLPISASRILASSRSLLRGEAMEFAVNRPLG